MMMLLRGLVMVNPNLIVDLTNDNKSYYYCMVGSSKAYYSIMKLTEEEWREKLKSKVNLDKVSLRFSNIQPYMVPLELVG